MRNDLERRRNRNQSQNPYRELFSLADSLNRVFDEGSFPMNLMSGESRLSPACDIEETDKDYLLSMDFPGFRKDDIQIDVSGNQIRVCGERKCEKDTGGKRHHSERSYGMFERMFTLPADVDADHIEASFDNGVLDLTIPKREGAQNKRIQIGEGKGHSAFASKPKEMSGGGEQSEREVSGKKDEKQRDTSGRSEEKQKTSKAA